jgi:hypothetical protein
LKEEPSLQNNPGTQPVLDFLYEFGKKFYLMNVGGTKGEGVEKVIKERKPKVSLKLYVVWEIVANTTMDLSARFGSRKLCRILCHHLLTSKLGLSISSSISFC